MSTAVFVIIGAVVVGAAISLYLWSRWSEREADYEPEQLSEEEAAMYQLGTHLGWDGNIAGATGLRRGMVRTSSGRVVKGPKSDAGRRDVTIPPHLLPAVADHLKAHAQVGAQGLLFSGRARRAPGALHALRRVLFGP